MRSLCGLAAVALTVLCLPLPAQEEPLDMPALMREIAQNMHLSKRTVPRAELAKCRTPRAYTRFTGFALHRPSRPNGRPRMDLSLPQWTAFTIRIHPLDSHGERLANSVRAGKATLEITKGSGWGLELTLDQQKGQEPPAGKSIPIYASYAYMPAETSALEIMVEQESAKPARFLVRMSP